MTLSAGDELTIHGALFGQNPDGKLCKFLPQVLAVYGSSDPASAGVVVRKAGKHYLTTVSHLYRIADLAHHFPSTQAEVPSSAPYTVYDKKDNVVGIIESFEDDIQQATASPESYQTDLCYIRLEKGVNFRVASDEDVRPWRFSRESDGDGVLYNRMLRVWCQGTGKDGRAMGMMMGAAVGQGFARRNVENSKFPEAAKSAQLNLANQMTRSLLWRCHGRFETMMGSSGSPIELVGDSEERVVIGFQNFEFPGRPLREEQWGNDESDLGNLEEDFTKAALESALYPFYGSFHLPTWVRCLEIVDGDVN
jgi:hypothetical protein